MNYDKLKMDTRVYPSGSSGAEVVLQGFLKLRQRNWAFVFPREPIIGSGLPLGVVIILGVALSFGPRKFPVRLAG